MTDDTARIVSRLRAAPLPMSTLHSDAADVIERLAEMSDGTATTWPRALIRAAWAGICQDGSSYWWPCLDSTHPYAGQWVPMIGEDRDWSREPEPLTDEDREVLTSVIGGGTDD